MNQPFHKIIFFFLAVSFFTVPAFGVKLAGIEAELTTDPCAYPYTYSEQFDARDRLAVWIDNRDMNAVPRIYATFLDDSSHTEYLIDINAPSAAMIRTDGRRIAYNIWDSNSARNIIRIADVNDINAPVIKDVNVTGYYISYIDIDNGIVAYYDQGDYSSIPARIYTFNAAEPNTIQYIAKEFTGYDFMNSNIAIDGDLLSYCGYEYDEVNYIYLYYLDVVNIADLNNPVVAKNYLPRDSNIGAETTINNLDTSGDWLVGYGNYMGTYGVFGIHNYQDANSANWFYTEPYVVAGGKGATVRVDEPFAVWVQDARTMPSNNEGSVGTQSEQSPAGIQLMGMVMFSNGKTNISVLKDVNDPYWTLQAATISGDNVVWGADYTYYDPETQTDEIYSDLFGDTIMMECGDKGYSLADFNHDCRVNFIDFAMFADRWLVCTIPDDGSCIDGEVFPAGENLWRVVLPE